MEHLLNCHGEWIALAQILALVPFAGVAVRMLLPASLLARVKRSHHDHGEDHVPGTPSDR